MYEIIDNFLGPEENLNLTKNLLSINFPWSIASKTGVMQLHGFNLDPLNMQNTHIFVSKRKLLSNHYHVIEKLANKINFSDAIRIKANCELAKNIQFKSDFHVDQRNKDKTPMEGITNCIYYLNTNNGYTEFKNGEIVESISDRLLVFPNTLYHRGVSQTNCSYRIAINFNVMLQ
jgi:hypothetical protein